MTNNRMNEKTTDKRPTLVQLLNTNNVACHPEERGISNRILKHLTNINHPPEILLLSFSLKQQVFTFCLDAKSNKKIKINANAPPLCHATAHPQPPKGGFGRINKFDYSLQWLVSIAI